MNQRGGWGDGEIGGNIRRKKSDRDKKMKRGDGIPPNRKNSVSHSHIGMTTAGCRCDVDRIYCLPVLLKRSDRQRDPAEVSRVMARRNSLSMNRRDNEKASDVKPLSSFGFDRRERSFMREDSG